MKRSKLGTISLISATMALTSLVSATPSVAKEQERTVKIYTTDRNKGGVLSAKITWTPARGSGYNGTIQGQYEDLQEDGYCVQGFKTGGKQRLPLGPTACPKGHSFAFHDAFSHVSKAAVQVCRVNNNNHKLANCSGWK